MMRIIPIDDFNDVILFEMQKRRSAGQYCALTFSEIWKAAAGAAVNFSAPVDSYTQRREFTARMMDTIRLLERIGFVDVDRNNKGQVRLIGMTEAGKKHVSKLVFSNQQQMMKC